MWCAASLHFFLLAVPLKQGDGGSVGDVEGASGAWDGDVDHHVALLQYLLADAVALVANDEGGVGGKLCLVDICCVRCRLDGDDFFICRDEFSKVVFLSEIPFNVIAA